MRKKSGHALVSVIVICFTALAFLLALAEIVTSAVRVVSANKWSESLRNAAEIGIDYAVNQYNSVPGGLDPVDPNSPTSSPITLPSAYLQAAGADCGAPNTTVTIRATRLINSDTQSWSSLVAMSSIYSPEMDPTGTASSFQNPTSIGNLKTPGGGYRIITSTASNGVYSRTIRTILVAQFPISGFQPDGTAPLMPTGSGATSPQSLFVTPLFTNGALTLNSPNLKIQGYNSSTKVISPTHQTNGYSAYDLNVTTNKLVSLGEGNRIVGDVTVLSSGSGNFPVFQAPAPSGQPSTATIDGRLTTYGSLAPSVVVQPGPAVPPLGAANVLANADQFVDPSSGRLGDNNNNPAAVNTLSPAPQVQVAPAPNAIGQPFSSFSSFLSQGTSVPPGAYSAFGLTTSDLGANAKPVGIDNSLSPVSFFVKDSGSSQAVNIDTSLIAASSNDARNLQIYYKGTDAVNINVNGDFNALVYAPNAPVTVSGTGTFSGGIVSGSLNVSMNGTMNIYTDLAVSSSSNSDSAQVKAAAAANRNAGLIYMGTSAGPVIQGWQPITWQEMK